MEIEQERASILRPIVIVAGIIIILAAIKAAASILSLFFLAVFLAIAFTPDFSCLRNKGVPSWLAVLITFNNWVRPSIVRTGVVPNQPIRRQVARISKQLERSDLRGF